MILDLQCACNFYKEVPTVINILPQNCFANSQPFTQKVKKSSKTGEDQKNDICFYVIFDYYCQQLTSRRELHPILIFCEQVEHKVFYIDIKCSFIFDESALHKLQKRYGEDSDCRLTQYGNPRTNFNYQKLCEFKRTLTSKTLVCNVRSFGKCKSAENNYFIIMI